MSHRGAGIEFNRSFELSLSPLPVPIILGNDACQYCANFCECPIYLNRFPGSSLRFWGELSWVSEHHREDRITISQSGISRGIARIFPNRALEIVKRLAQ